MVHLQCNRYAYGRRRLIDIVKDRFPNAYNGDMFAFMSKTSLVDERGLFLVSNAVRKLAMMLKLPKREIIAESQAQIDKIEEAGVKVS